MTMFELSPSVETTAASAAAAPARSSTSSSIPWPTTNPPRHSPRRASAVSSSSTHVMSQPSPASSFATDDPTRPQPMIIAFMRLRLLVEHAVGERDDEHLARRVAQDVVDGRREEPRLPAPARRRAEHDQVGLAARRLVDDRVPDRPRVDGLGADVDAVLLTQGARLGNG